MAGGPIERAVALLARVADEPGDATVAALASDAGLPTSTAYRLLAALERHGLVQRDATSTVSLGTRMVALGRAAEASLQERLVEPAAPAMERLVRERGETAILTAPCGVEAIVVHTVETEEHSVRLSYATYRRAPMHLGASGKVLAAWLEPHERERLLRSAGDPELDRVLTEVRERGWVLTSGEVDAGVSAVAAPIRDVRGRLLAGLSLAGPSSRMAAAGFAATAQAVCDAAGTIEAAIAARDE
jgi:DNA-binding IclR family transcriptional regulator